MTLKELRIDKNLTQQQVADFVGISLRSYKSYENDSDKMNSLKYNYIFDKLSEINVIDEEHGILSREDIINKCRDIFSNYDVDFCYLFGSYAKSTATETSDVDLLISSKVRGIKFYGMVEELREKLHKRIDALDSKQLANNLKLVEEILKDGIKIYG